MSANSDSLLVPECIYRPGSFSGLMLLYESNYLKLMRLIGGIDASDGYWISRVRNDSDLHVERKQLERYTTTLNMTYWLRGTDGFELKDPDMTVRIYHDAAQAGVLQCQSSHQHSKLRELAAASHARELSRRWHSNMMLNKWLDYLGDCGHRIP